jgi:hypothetical protein
MFDQNSTQPNELQIFTNHYFMNFSFKKSQQFMVLIIDHVWTNAPIRQCM